MGRKFVEHEFGPGDDTFTFPTWEGGVQGKIAVFGRLTGTGGAATVHVYGSFSGFESTGLAGGSGLTNAEVQTLDFGGIIAGDFWLGTLDISELGNVANPEFVGQDLEPNTSVAVTGRNSSRSENFIPGNPADVATLPPIDDSESFTLQQATTPSRTQQVVANETANSAYRGYIPEQDFTLTFNGHTTSTITASTNMTAAIQAALVGLVDFDAGDVSVAKVSASVYTVTFTGAYEGVDVGAITITNVVGFTATGVTESTQGGTDTSGGSGFEDITDTATLANAVGQIVANQENKYPYLTLVFGGDADPGLTAEVYVVTY